MTVTPHPLPSTMQPSSSSPFKVLTPNSIPIQSTSRFPSPSPSDTEPHFTRRPSSSSLTSRESDHSLEGQRQQQRSSSTWRPSQLSSPFPPGSREEYTTLTISSSSSLSNGASQRQPIPAQEVSEIIPFLQSDKSEKENDETQSLNPHLASQTQESVTPRAQAQKDLESNSIPIVRTIPDETPLSESKIEQVQEETPTYAELIANAHPYDDEISKLRQNPDRDIETQESGKMSILPQVKETSEIVIEHQQMLVEEKPELVVEGNTMEIENTKEANPDPETIVEAIQEDQPKVDFKSHEPITPYVSNEESNSKTELNSSIVQPDSMQTQVHPETVDSSKLENMSDLSEKEQTNMMPVVPPASPRIAGDYFHKEIKGDSNLDEKMNSKHSQEAAEGEHMRRIIYVAGKNQGASMYIGHEELKTVNKVDQQKEESKVHDATRKEEFQVVNNDVLSSISINCIVQSINNSILHESSCSQDKPGVHLIFSRKPTETFYSINGMDQFVL